MKQIRWIMIVWIALVSIQCSDASAPASEPDPPDPVLPVVSPSGRIAFVTQTSTSGAGALYIANSDGSELRQLHSGPTFYQRPRWSPDRRRIAFSISSIEPPSTSILVIDVDGPEGVRRLGTGTDPAWSPDGSKIAFVRGTPGGFGIHVMNADGSNVRQLTAPNDPEQCRQGASASDWAPDWSPDGLRILFERDFHTAEGGDFDCGLDGWGYVPNIYVMNADGTGQRRFRPVDLWYADGEPAWSPDGRFVAYSTHTGGLYIVDRDATYAAEPVVAAIPGVALSPAWSPDSRKLLVLSALNGASPANRLVIVDPGSRSVQTLSFPTVPGYIGGPAWSR